MVNKLGVLLLVLLLSGCGAEDVAKVTASGVNRYCGTFTEAERGAIRVRVAELVAPHKVIVDCDGDGLGIQ